MSKEMWAVSSADKLSQRETEKLNRIRKDVLNEYRQKALEMFDEDKNQSLMLSQKANQMRNQIMVDFKYEQMKRSKLRERMRQAKKDIIADRTDHADPADEGGKAQDEKRQASDKVGVDTNMANVIGSNT